MLSEVQTNNFDTLIHAVENHDVALMECTIKATGEKVAVICASYKDEEGRQVFVPFAQLFNGDPYEILEPPGGAEEVEPGAENGRATSGEDDPGPG